MDVWKTTTNENLNKIAWSHQATVALIETMREFLNDMEHPVRKKQVFNDVNKILNSIGFSDHTPMQCQLKWKSLLRTYRANKYNTHKAKCRFYFFDKMDELLSKRSKAGIKHTLESNDNNSSSVLEDNNPLDDEEEDPIPDQNEEIQYETIVDEDVEDDEILGQYLRYTIKDDRTKIEPVSANEGDEEMEYAENDNTETIVIEPSNKWSYEASMAIIDIMENFLDDLGHPVKRKHVFTSVNEHLISMGFEGFTPTQCSHKWKNLVRTYRVNKANNRRRGQASRFHFFDKMDKLLCKRYTKSDATTPKAVPREDAASVAVNKVQAVQEKQSVVKTCTHEEMRERARQKRHNERIAIEREKCQIERRKVAILERILAKLD